MKSGSLLAAIALMLASRTSFSQPLTHFGLEHCPLGQALLDIDPQGNLIVSNIGSSGDDGVSIALGETEFHTFFFDAGAAAALPDGSNMTIMTIGELNDLPDQFIATLSITDTGDVFGLSTDISAISPVNVRVEARSGGTVLDLVDFGLPAPTDFLVCFPPLGCDVDPVWTMPDEIWAIVNLVNPQPVTITGSATVEADEIVVIAEFPSNEVGPLSETRIQAADIPEFTFFTETLGMFQHRHTALGDAVFGAVGGSSLTISNIGASGEDGVSIELEDTESFSMQFPSFDPMGMDGALLVLSARGTLSGNPDQFLGSLTFEDVGNVLEITPDYSPIGSSTQLVQILDDGVEVASVSGVSGVVATVPDFPWPNGCRKVGPIGPDLPCFVGCYRDDILFTISGGPTVSGDEIRVLAEGADPIDSLSGFSLRAANTGDITIEAEVAPPAVPAGIDYCWAGPPGNTHNWGEPSNWIPVGVPNNPGDTATFGDVIDVDTTILLDDDFTISSIFFEEQVNSYTLGVTGGGNLIFDAIGLACVVNTGPTVVTLCGDIIHSCLEVHAVVDNSGLVFSGNISGVAEFGEASMLLNETNNGTVTLEGTGSFTGEVRVQNGVLRLSASKTIPDDVTLFIETPGSVLLDTGISEVVGGLNIDGVDLAPGTYDNTTNGIEGDGVIIVNGSVQFIRGDCNGNATFDGLGDGLTALNFQFIPGTPAPPCLAACDANNNRTFDGLGDGLRILNHQFVPGTPPPDAPFPRCGQDQNAVDALGCDSPVCP